MKSFICALIFWMGVSLLRAGEMAPVTFYVQLVRGSDSDIPPEAQAHLIGSRLDQRLHDVFKWKNYWELKRETVTVAHGSKVRKRISSQREIEISWMDARTMSVSIYADGRLTRKQTQPITTSFYITGGDKDLSQPWFIIVRRDDPDAPIAGNSKITVTP